MRKSTDVTNEDLPNENWTYQARDSRIHVWLDYAQAMQHLRVSRSTLDGWRRSGHISFVKLPNGQLRIRRAALDEWLESMAQIR